MVQTQFGEHINRIHFDNDEEYVNFNFFNFISKQMYHP